MKIEYGVRCYFYSLSNFASKKSQVLKATESVAFSLFVYFLCPISRIVLRALIKFKYEYLENSLKLSTRVKAQLLLYSCELFSVEAYLIKYICSTADALYDSMFASKQFPYT